MTLQPIFILRHGEHRDEIDADVEGCWAIHPAIPVQLNRFSLTHIPTGYEVLHTETEIAARCARADLLVSDLDWTFTDPKAVTSVHRVFGKRLREKYQGK